MWRLTRLAHRVAPELPSSTPTRLPKPTMLAIGQLQVHTRAAPQPHYSQWFYQRNTRCLKRQASVTTHHPSLLAHCSAHQHAEPHTPRAPWHPNPLLVALSLCPPCMLLAQMHGVPEAQAPSPQEYQPEAQDKAPTKPVTPLPHQPAPCMPQPCPPCQPEPEIAPASFAARSLSAAFAAATQLETFHSAGLDTGLPYRPEPAFWTLPYKPSLLTPPY
jgi:hypothetical protein